MPVAADTPGPGTYRGLQMAYETCNDSGCTSMTRISLQAAVEPDGSRWIDFRYDNGTTVLVGQAYTDTPDPFTLSGDFIVGVPTTTMSMSYSDGSPTPQTQSVTVSASVSLTGKVRKSTTNQVVKGTNCTSRFTTRSYSSAFTGSFTFNGTPYTPNATVTNDAYSVVTVSGNCP